MAPVILPTTELVVPLLRRAWARSDRVFGLLADEAWTAQPIALRQPFVFYLGHLPAFAWNHLGAGVLGRPRFAPDLDDLFERGIDPVGVDTYTPRAQWPPLPVILEYRDRIRAFVAEALEAPEVDAELRVVATMVLEHELMHHETLLYMLHELPHGQKRRPTDWPALPTPPTVPPAALRGVRVPAGETVLGAPVDPDVFAWDNERPEQRVAVPAFTIDDRPVTNAEFLEFVRAGGYEDERLWRDEDWAWRSRLRLGQPHSWIPDGAGSFRCRTLFEDVPLAMAASWPVMTSWAEAAAYARWRGARLPTEPELHRAAYGAPDGAERPWPWGDEAPDASRGAFDFQQGSPVPVGSHPAGRSAWGVDELLGNGWEWTSSAFGPLPGFQPLPRYPGYSADFFDGQHFVMTGGSWATDARLLRRSFRNWFQPHYPYVFTKFRCVGTT